MLTIPNALYSEDRQIMIIANDDMHKYSTIKMLTIPNAVRSKHVIFIDHESY